MSSIEEFLRYQRSKKINNIVIQKMSNINKRDEFIIKLNKVLADFNKVNGNGKSFNGIEELKVKLIAIQGNKKLIDTSSNTIYSKWSVDGMPYSTFFIGIAENGKEVNVNFEDAEIVD